MSDEKVIKLNVKKEDFEEIYFSGNQASLFFSPTTKLKTITTIIVAVVLIITLLLKDNFSKEKFGIVYFISFLLLLCTVYLSLALNKVARWKKQVNNYLTKLANCKNYDIIYNENFFTVNINDDKETSEWKDFNFFDSNNEFISLEGKYSYMFPRKSMSERDYSTLKQVLKKNITQ